MNVEFIYLSNRAKVKKELVEYSIDSVRKVMLDALITQISDGTTEKVPGVNEVIRVSNDTIPFKKSTYADFMFSVLEKHGSPRSLVIDTDIIFDLPIEKELFEGDYDLLMCSRCSFDYANHNYTPTRVTFQTPYQGGIFSVSDPKFWGECRERHAKVPWSWLSGQIEMNSMIQSGEYNCRILDGNIYNRTVAYKGETDNGVKVWHYAGSRKNWIPYHTGKESRSLV